VFKKLFEKFKKESEVEINEEISLSKIDKHMNFILRDNLGSINKQINEKIININHKKEEAVVTLRELHKSKLMNGNIPEREIHIMDGNRDNYIKKISHFLTGIDVPKNYLDTYDYCIKHSQDLEQLSREIQKNIFVLQHFFSNEVKNTNKALHDLEEIIIEIRVLLEKNGIIHLKKIQKDIKLFIDNTLKIKDFKEQILNEQTEINNHQDKLSRLNERIHIITTGTDYRALETFRQEKGAAENEIKKILVDLTSFVSILDIALRKYYYLNPDKKIIKNYLDEVRTAILEDTNLEIREILKGVKKAVENDEIDLKDRKKEHCLETLEKLTLEYLKETQSQVLKLEDQKQRAQTKITHNSASLNLSEQQYWINATEDKIKYHNSNIEKLERNINSVDLENAQILITIREELETLMNKKIKLKDDLTESVLLGDNGLKEKETQEKV
jgi:hypothetical protein